MLCQRSGSDVGLFWREAETAVPTCLPAGVRLPMDSSLYPRCLSSDDMALKNTHLSVCLTVGLSVCLYLSDCMPACLRLYACLSARLSDNFKALANDSCHSFYLLSISSAVQHSCLSIW